MRPVDVNGINKAAGENYHLLYNNVFNVRACSLRLTNVYGPRQLIRHNRQGFIGWFIRLALEGREIQIFGDGSQMRDFVYVDDAADAFLRAGASDACNGQVFNVGGSEPISHKDLVALLIDVAGAGSVRYVPWPAEKKAIDIGSFYADSSRFRSAVGWEPRVTLRDGLRENARVLPRARRRVPRRLRVHAIDRGMSVRVPFIDLHLAEESDAVREAIARVIDRAWFVLGTGGRGVRAGIRRRIRRAARCRRRQRHRRARADPSRARHRPRRRGHHDAAVGRVHGASRSSWRAHVRSSPISIPSD